jgi:type II secretory ATPase GspE/PulE/Tfp pilus assembly ATPase PilB-like protein
MADMHAPLNWDMPARSTQRMRADTAAAEVPGSSGVKEKSSREAFRWPTPPLASYPAPTEQTETLPCQILSGPDLRIISGRLTFFVPETSVAHVQMPPARTTVPLRFDQFKVLTLTTPLLPLPLPLADPHAELLSQRQSSPYVVHLVEGGDLKGQTIGHVEMPEVGLFLFPPLESDGSVKRMFVPACAFKSFEIGKKIGEVLVDEQHATWDQVTDAMELQDEMRHKKIGDILVTKQIVSPDQLLEAIERQHKMPMVRIGEALLSLGMVSNGQLKDALMQQQIDRSVPLGEVLVRMGVVSRDDLQTALARKMGYPLVNLDAFPAEVEALRSLSYTVASRLRVMPLLIRDGRLVVALDDPSRRSALDEVEFNADMKVIPVLARGTSIEAAVHAAYEKLGSAVNKKLEDLAAPIQYDLTPLTSSTDQLVETLEKEGLARSEGGDDEKPVEQSDNSLVRLLNNMIIEAHEDGVSDIHIESYPGKEKIRVRFRKDGVLRTYLELPASYRNALIARVKIMCDLDISERRKPQDGKINFAKFSPKHKIELRVATIPTNNGLEDVVLRILASARPIPIDMLGFAKPIEKALLYAVERPYGLVLCVGPTGSGKTTTLHSSLSHINVPERKIWTAEDPVEITQPGLRQVQINARIDWTFPKALRAFMRADPDVIMLGEIRDEETAHMAIEASLTGHLVLSTLHTNSAPETVTRLLDMGMDPFSFGDALLAVLAQRLVRRSCQNCKTPRPPASGEIEQLLGDYMNAFGPEPPVTQTEVLAGWTKKHSVNGRLVMYKSIGCEKCDHTGLKSRAGIHEMMVVSREIRRMIQNGARAEALQTAAMKEGMRTLRQDGIEKVLSGEMTIEEVRATSNS